MSLYKRGKGSNSDLFPNQYLFQQHEKKSPIFCNGNGDLFITPPLTSIVKMQQLDSETFPRSVPVRFSLIVDLTWTLLGNVSCVTA